MLVCFLALILELNYNLRCAVNKLIMDPRLERGGETYFLPSRMNDLRPLPRPVEVAFPPRAIVIAERTALLPPEYVG